MGQGSKNNYSKKTTPQFVHDGLFQKKTKNGHYGKYIRPDGKQKYKSHDFFFFLNEMNRFKQTAVLNIKEKNG